MQTAGYDVRRSAERKTLPEGREVAGIIAHTRFIAGDSTLLANNLAFFKEHYPGAPIVVIQDTADMLVGEGYFTQMGATAALKSRLAYGDGLNDSELARQAIQAIEHARQTSLAQSYREQQASTGTAL